MRNGWLILAGITAVLASWAGGAALAQEAEAEPVIEAEEIDVSKIDQILRGEQEVLQGELFSYDPANRRDPFRSLLEGFEEEDVGEKVRPPGLAGMMIEELKLEGIIVTESGILAFVQGRDNYSHILRPGTKLYNGEVKEILPKKIVFRRQVNDPKQIKPYEEFVREISD